MSSILFCQQQGELREERERAVAAEARAHEATARADAAAEGLNAAEAAAEEAAESSGARSAALQVCRLGLSSVWRWPCCCLPEFCACNLLSIAGKVCRMSHGGAPSGSMPWKPLFWHAEQKGDRYSCSGHKRVAMAARALASFCLG